MKEYQISASIVVYENDPVEVMNAIKSVVTSSLRVSCTVVDNSPTRTLEQHVSASGANYIYTGKNLGFGRAHNFALRANSNSSEYQLVLNPDVHFDSDVLRDLYRVMNANPEIGLLMPRILYSDGSDQRLCKQLPSPVDLLLRRFLKRLGKSIFTARLDKYQLCHLDLNVAREVPCLSGCFMLIPSTVLCEVGFFDPRYFMYMEDVDLCRRIGRKFKTVFYPYVAVVHGYRKGSYHSFQLFKHHLQSALIYFGKWGWIFDPEREKLNKRTDPLHP